MLSIIIPIHRERDLLEVNLHKLLAYLNSLQNEIDFEIIIVDNGMESYINDTLTKMPKVKLINIEKRGLGLALKTGLSESRGDYLIFYAIDLPFGLNIIKESVEEATLRNYDLVLGSKGHKDSVVNVNYWRKIISYLLNYLIRLLYKLDIRDTQGSFLISRDLYNKIKYFITSDSAWAQAQIVIYSHLINGRIAELPIKYTDIRSGSKMVFSDGVKYIYEMLWEIQKKNKYARSTKNFG